MVFNRIRLQKYVENISFNDNYNEEGIKFMISQKFLIMQYKRTVRRKKQKKSCQGRRKSCIECLILFKRLIIPNPREGKVET